MIKSDFKLKDSPVFVLDCQTTGASPRTGNLLEIAWKVTTASTVDEQISSYLVEQPDGLEVPARIESLTGITNDDMVDATSPGRIIKAFREDLKKVSRSPICVIHYARFELPFLLTLFQDHGRRKSLPLQSVCTFEIARRLYPNLPSRGIRALGGFLGMELDELKRASSHVTTTAAIWSHLVEVLKEQGVEQYSELVQFLESKPEKRKGKLEYPLAPEKRLGLPDKSGVYRMLNCMGKVLYVGKATSLRSRVNSHFRGRKRKTSRSFELLTQVTDIQVTECESPLEASLVETDQIKQYDPAYNTSLKARDRKLWFYSSDFTRSSNKQSARFPLGPFSSSHIVDDVKSLSHCLANKTAFEGMLYGIDDADLIDEGIELFAERYSQELDQDFSVVNLLLLGMRLFRWNRNLVRAMKEEEAALELAGMSSIEEEQEDELSDGFEEDGDGEPEELTEEDVLARLESTVIHLARSYLLAKELTKLMDSSFYYSYQGKLLKAEIRGGYLLDVGDGLSGIKNSAELKALKSRMKVRQGNKLSGAWKGLDIATFDRLRVLSTEIRRIQNQGDEIELEPNIYLLSRF